MKSKLADWEEQDMVYDRRWYAYLQRAGVTRRIKRRMHKRWRREGIQEVRKELTMPNIMTGDRTLLEDRRGYSAIDTEYFEEHYLGK